MPPASATCGSLRPYGTHPWGNHAQCLPSKSSSTADSIHPADFDSLNNRKDQTSLGKIPKPEGEAGRPGQNGYNLHAELKWDNDTYKHIKVSISQVICDVLQAEIITALH